MSIGGTREVRERSGVFIVRKDIIVDGSWGFLFKTMVPSIVAHFQNAPLSQNNKTAQRYPKIWAYFQKHTPFWEFLTIDGNMFC